MTPVKFGILKYRLEFVQLSYPSGLRVENKA
jgi:hypothetical protein